MESVTEPQPSASTSDHADDDDDVPADTRSVCLDYDEGITACEVAVPGLLVNFVMALSTLFKLYHVFQKAKYILTYFIISMKGCFIKINDFS